MQHSVTVQCDPLTIPAQLPLSRRTDGPTTTHATSCASLLECQQFLASVIFVVDLSSRVDQILKMCSSQEVAQVDKVTVVLVLNVDHAPTVLTCANLATVYVDCLLGANNCEWDKALRSKCQQCLVFVIFYTFTLI